LEQNIGNSEKHAQQNDIDEQALEQLIVHAQRLNEDAKNTKKDTEALPDQLNERVIELGGRAGAALTALSKLADDASTKLRSKQNAREQAQSVNDKLTHLEQNIDLLLNQAAKPADAAAADKDALEVCFAFTN
jgi:DNA-binding ferritin-like protein